MKIHHENPPDKLTSPSLMRGLTLIDTYNVVEISPNDLTRPSLDVKGSDAFNVVEIIPPSDTSLRHTVYCKSLTMSNGFLF